MFSTYRTPSFRRREIFVCYRKELTYADLPKIHSRSIGAKIAFIAVSTGLGLNRKDGTEATRCRSLTFDKVQCVEFPYAGNEFIDMAAAAQQQLLLSVQTHPADLVEYEKGKQPPIAKTRWEVILCMR